MKNYSPKEIKNIVLVGAPGSGKTTLAELADRAAEMGTCQLPESGKQEYLEGVVNRALFG